MQKKPKTIVEFSLSASKRLVFAGLAFMVIAGSSLLGVKLVGAQSVNDQISALEAQNAANRDQVAKLQDQATSYQDAINQLQAAINSLQAQINANTAQQAQLQKDIEKAEADLAQQKDLLGKDIRAMYVEGDISTLEMLASSNDISEFVDKQQYHNSVKDKITETLTKINDLKHQLSGQKERIDALIKEQQQQQSDLASSRSQQANLLSYNVAQQADFNQKTKDNEKKISDLIASQRASNFNPDGGYYFLRFPGAVHGFNPNDYPYKNAGFGMSPGPGCVDNDGPDQWGYCTRQCVSYAAWAVVASGRDAPMYFGSAKNWVAKAYANGVPVYRSPQPGDIAISTSGYWGHAMYVQSVSGNTFSTSEYNTNLDGRLYYRTRSF